MLEGTRSKHLIGDYFWAGKSKWIKCLAPFVRLCPRICCVQTESINHSCGTSGLEFSRVWYNDMSKLKYIATLFVQNVGPTGLGLTI